MDNNLQSQLDVSVDCVVFGFHNNKLRVLVIEQENLTKRDVPRYALPGDLVMPDEHIDHAAERILFELTNLKGIYLEQFHTFGNPNRVFKEEDLKWLNQIRKNPNARVITIAYYALVKMEDYTPSPSSYAEKAEWKDIDEVPDLVFDHNKILKTALKKLRKEVENHNVGFELLPEKFTLGQLQQLYEVILDTELDKRNFRKTIKKMDSVLALDEKQKGVLHKPAQLYTYIGKRKEVD